MNPREAKGADMSFISQLIIQVSIPTTWSMSKWRSSLP